MKKNQLRVSDYLGHILEAIERIDTYIEDVDEVHFLQNRMLQDAVIRNIEVIGEAASNIKKHHPEFAEQKTEIPWNFMYLMRNRVSHGYFSVDFEVIWKTVKNDIPELAPKICHLQQSYQNSPNKNRLRFKP